MACNSTKRIKDDEFLLIKNSINTGVDSISSRKLNPYIELKPNSKLLFGLPLKLYIYNWGKPHPDSTFINWLTKKPKRQKQLTKLLSERQLKNIGDFYVNIHEARKANGEPPSVITKPKIDESKEKLKSWYWNRGWFNAEVNHNIEKDSSKQKATIHYNIKPNKPYLIDTISYNIESIAADSLYNSIKDESLIKKGQQFNTQNFENERLRVEKYFRNHGLYNFDREYISFVVDSLNENARLLEVEMTIKNRKAKNTDSIIYKPFEAHKISQVNVFTDYENTDNDYLSKDSIHYKQKVFFAKDKIKVSPKILSDAVFIEKGQLFSDEKRISTYNRFSNIRVFEYPNIQYQKDPRTPDEDNLIANVFLTPKKRFGFTSNFEVSQSNIQDFGIGVNTSFLARNALRLADVLELSFRANLGSSRDAASNNDQFFNITELGGNLSLSLPKVLFPFTQTIIKKDMQPSSRLSYGFNTQKNIGLDRQNHTFRFDYNWKPNKKVSNRLSLIDFQFVNNLNINNYFNIFTNSYRDLNQIAQDNLFEVDENFIDPNTLSLSIPTGTDGFVNQVNNGEISLNDEEQQFFNSIVERKDRLTENNLILASNFTFDYSTRKGIDDNDYYQFRSRFELAGNLLKVLGTGLGLNENDNANLLLFDVPFTQYAKLELNYIKHWDLGNKNIIAARAFGGLALPYGNSQSIPFARSFFGGGPNDNRGWQPYDLGPGKTNGINDFNEANFKLSFNLEYRFNIFGSLNSAFFIDAGNIWNLADNVTDKDATFDGLKDLEDLSVATGIGFRYDITFFVIRLDFGFKTYNPGDIEKKWFNDYNFNNMVFNFGINYPF